ncbi:hypothetical protein HY310_00980, partial [Candidatus Microgenomates bacterium]|nr:hypothetical protein [Candidatus Microgenomates bacterium]
QLTAPANGLIVSGNVGIGTSAPQGVLDVNGTSFFRGVLTTSGNVGVGGSITGYGALNGLNVTGLTNLANVNATGNVSIGSSLTVTGLGVFNGGLQTNNLNITGLTQGGTLFAGNNGLITQNTANYYWDNTNKKLGIGTSNPQYKLDIFGGSPIAAFGRIQATNDSGMEILFNGGSAGTTTKGEIGYGKSGSGADTIFTGETANSFNVKASIGALHLGAGGDQIIETLTTGGNVGIGATTVNAKFYVNGGAAIGSGYNITAPTNGLIVQGNVGIGTSNANLFNLQVKGDIGPELDNTYDLGSSSVRWKSLHLGPGSLVVHNDTTNTNKLTLDFSSSTAQVITDAATPLQLTTGTNRGLVIDTSGNL